MELSYRQLEATLVAHFKIKPDRVATFRSRIKQLQRMEFPSGVNIGRGAKMTYNAQHLFKLVTAFELIGIGLPAKSATDLVDRHWDTFAAGYALALMSKHWHRGAEQIFALIEIQSLHEIQFSSFLEPSVSEVTLADWSYLEWFFRNNASRDYRCLPVMLLSEIYERTNKAASDYAGVSYLRVLDWRPKGYTPVVRFRSLYPDRSNLEMRKHLHRSYGSDPDALTPEAEEEARQFHKDYFAPPDF